MLASRGDLEERSSFDIIAATPSLSLPWSTVPPLRGLPTCSQFQPLHCELRLTRSRTVTVAEAVFGQEPGTTLTIGWLLLADFVLRLGFVLVLGFSYGKISSRYIEWWIAHTEDPRPFESRTSCASIFFRR